MIYTEEERREIERVRKVFEEHIRQSGSYEILWSDKVGYVWLAISLRYHYVDTGRQIVSAADLCSECLNDVAMDVLLMTGNEHALEEADPLELAEILSLIHISCGSNFAGRRFSQNGRRTFSPSD